MYDFQIQFGDKLNTTGGFDPDTVTRCPADLIPLPGHENLDVMVTDDNNDTCIALQGEITISVPITTLQGSQTAFFNVPKDAQVSGNCPTSGNIQSLTLSFAQDWEMMFTFEKADDDTVSVAEVLLFYDTSLFQTQPPAKAANHTVTFSPSKPDFLKFNSGGYYKCDANNTLVDLSQQNVKLTAANFKYKAFGKEGQGDVFTGSASDCQADSEPADSAVPIIVGACCAAIVSVILVWYLWRRPQAKQSYDEI